MLILPVGIINLPLIIFNENDEFDNWGERFGIGVLCYTFLFLISLMERNKVWHLPQFSQQFF